MCTVPEGAVQISAAPPYNHVVVNVRCRKTAAFKTLSSMALPSLARPAQRPAPKKNASS
jgi:hypothetical protein